MKTIGVVLAAGLSSRMGKFKPLLPLGNRTVLEACLTNMLYGGVEKIVLVIGYNGQAIKQYFANSQLAPYLIYVTNEAYQATDMLYSIKLALHALPPCDNFFLAPGDMPLISPKTFQQLQNHWHKESDQILCPWIGERKRHPLLISYDFVAEIETYAGKDGLRGLFRTCPNALRTIEIFDEGCLIDLDTFDDYKWIQPFVKQQKLNLSINIGEK